VRVEGHSQREVVRRWHEHLTVKGHLEEHDAAELHEQALDACGCRTIVRRGLVEVESLLVYPS
jgi:hypothetical protein